MFKSSKAGVVSAAVAPAPTNPEDAMRQALLAVVQVWLDRLQAMAVVTTFFVSIDGLLFSLTSPTRPIDIKAWSMRDEVVNASLGGAIILHVCGAITAYVGSFILIRYRLTVAEKTEEQYEESQRRRDQYTRQPTGEPPSRRQMPSSLERSTIGPADDEKRRTRRARHRTSPSGSSTLVPETTPIDALRDLSQVTWATYTDLRTLVSVHRVRPLSFLRCGAARNPGTRDRDMEAGSRMDDAVAMLESLVALLSRCHSLSAAMSSLGFILALLGIMTYAWTAVPTALGIFASACMGACLLAMVVTVAST